MPKATEHNITRRTALAGVAATFPAAAIPAFAFPSEPDPIFAAIEAHKEGYAFLTECIDKAEKIECELADRADEIADAQAPECIPLRKAFDHAKETVEDWQSDAFRKAQDRYCDSRHNRIRCQAIWGELAVTPEHAEVDRLNKLGHEALSLAEWALFDVVPTTAAGAVAKISYILELEIRGDGPFDGLRDATFRTGDPCKQSSVEAILVSLTKYLTALSLGCGGRA